MMASLQLELTVVTPAFVGGADPNDHSELRPPSIKGQLRFWHRAINPDYRSLEPEAFGSADHGQSPLGLALGGDIQGTTG